MAIAPGCIQMDGQDSPSPAWRGCSTLGLTHTVCCGAVLWYLQVLVEQSLIGCKEFELEVMRNPPQNHTQCYPF
jgi:hypothetical protein